jgi:hypothetical protein
MSSLTGATLTRRKIGQILIILSTAVVLIGLFNINYPGGNYPRGYGVHLLISDLISRGEIGHQDGRNELKVYIPRNCVWHEECRKHPAGAHDFRSFFGCTVGWYPSEACSKSLLYSFIFSKYPKYSSCTIDHLSIYKYNPSAEVGEVEIEWFKEGIHFKHLLTGCIVIATIGFVLVITDTGRKE